MSSRKLILAMCPVNICPIQVEMLYFRYYVFAASIKLDPLCFTGQFWSPWCPTLPAALPTPCCPCPVMPSAKNPSPAVCPVGTPSPPAKIHPSFAKPCHQNWQRLFKANKNVGCVAGLKVVGCVAGLKVVGCVAGLKVVGCVACPTGLGNGHLCLALKTPCFWPGPWAQCNFLQDDL